MSTKERVLEILYRCGSASGEAIAAELGLSRMAVCKAVDALRSDGYEINSKPRAGYSLSGDALCGAVIGSALKKPHTLEVLPTVSSTNTYLREGDFPSGHVVLSLEQTAGKGRRGKSFISPRGSGLYFSFIMKDSVPIENMWAVTFMAAIAVAKTLRSYGADAGIKWVNDVYVNGRKICGILTEVTLDAEARTSREIVVGIGINMKKAAYPDEIKGVAISLEEAGASARVCDVAASVINLFDGMYADFDIPSVLREYRALCFMLGMDITYIKNGESHSAKAKAILDNGNLSVESDGEERILSSGEISISIGE